MYTTFTTNNTRYETNDRGNYFYAIDETANKRRISKTEFEAAYEQFNRETNESKLDEAAENPEITLEQFAEMVQDAEESAVTEEITEIQKEMTPKAKRTRKSKDIAYEMTVELGDGPHTVVTLTAKQVDFIRHLPDTNFWEQGLDSCVWVDILCDEIGGQFANKPMTVGAMISTLCEKGLGTRGTDRRNGRKCVSFALTDLGKIAATELGVH